MIIDGLLQFDPSGTAITAGGASTNVIDLLNARDMGVGDDPALKIAVIVGTAFTAAGAATLQVQIQTSPDNSTWSTVAQSDAVPKANLTSGAQFVMDMPRRYPGSTSNPRYIRLNYVVGTGPMTAGTVFAAMLLDKGSDNYFYPAGVTVSN